MLTIPYTVHSAAKSPVTTEATIPGGQVVTAVVAGLVVELVDSRNQSITLRMIPDDMDEAMALFQVDGTISVNFSAPEPPAEEED